MSLDIGEAFSEGISRTVAKNGLLLAVVFAVVALLTTVLFQTFLAGLLEAILEFMQSASTSELGIPQSEYDQALEQLRNTAQQTRQT
ncbi:MAG: Na+-translocating ferredoxin:NAD+ oxidoreductase RnfG subunit, partial [Natronomonas sp.]